VYAIYGNSSQNGTLSQSGSCSNPSSFNYVTLASQQPGVPSQIAYGANGLNYPSSIATTPKGVIWVDDYSGLSAFTGVANTANASYNAHTTAGAGGLSAPGLLAIDGSNNVWVSQGSSLVEYVTSGTYGTAGSFANTAGFTGGGLKNANSIAIDGAGNVWLGGSALSEFSNTGTPLSPSTGYVPAGWSSVAIDGSGDVWGSSSSGMIEMIGAAVPVVTPVSAGAGTRP
jgi:ligand-binding sensor domain-containing protein